MTIIQQLRRTFRKMTTLEMATAELGEAQLSKLEAESARDYATSIVAYNTMRIKRLQEFINANTAT